jgi:hypothetical protein
MGNFDYFPLEDGIFEYLQIYTVKNFDLSNFAQISGQIFSKFYGGNNTILKFLDGVFPILEKLFFVVFFG